MGGKLKLAAIFDFRKILPSQLRGKKENSQSVDRFVMCNALSKGLPCHLLVVGGF